jgi:hypothetical protein
LLASPCHFSNRDKAPEAGVNDALAVEAHWLGRDFRVSVDKIRTVPARFHCALHIGGTTAKLTRKRAQ